MDFLHTSGPATTQQATTNAVDLSRKILLDLFGPPERRAFAVVFWDGSREQPGHQAPEFTLVLRRPDALRRMLVPPSELTLAEAYLRGDIEIEGDPGAASGVADTLGALLAAPGRLARVALRLQALPHTDGSPVPADGGRFYHAGLRHSLERDRAAVRHHYDLGNDFYALWLDRRMVYSCAYFPTGGETLDEAQEAKLELICRKLRLRPGERLLDIGCGWGGLICYAAERYGVEALGITLSQAQAELARERIAAAGLSGRCRVEICDYRELPPAAVFDKVVSVGMVEHVGRTQMPTYFEAAFRHTRPGGLFLNHGIVLAAPPPRGALSRLGARLWGQGAFIQRYIFPDGELLPAGEMLSYAEEQGFEPRDLESLREHYALTLDHWRRRLEERRNEAVALVGEQVYRAWRLYLAGSAWRFRVGQIGIVQMLFARQTARGRVELPSTRADLYAERPLERSAGA
ncbi:MAG: cyclopropane-fatty-acyl-phospholipid synthase family protein [Chloroflexaceae bacterium]